MLSKESEHSPIPAFKAWMSTHTEFSFDDMSSETYFPKSTPGVQVSSPGQTVPNSALPESSSLFSGSDSQTGLRLSSSVIDISPEIPEKINHNSINGLTSLPSDISPPHNSVSSPGLSPGLPHSSPGVPVSSSSLPLASPGLPVSAILSPSQIKQEPTTSILVNELLSRDISCYSIQFKNNASSQAPSSVTVCKREPSDIKIENQQISHLSHPNAPVIAKIKEEYPDLCDMVGVDKTTYLEFLNNPILPSISEVEQLLEQCSDTAMSHCRPHLHQQMDCLPSALSHHYSHVTCKTEPQTHHRQMPPLIHHDSSLSPPYQGSYMDTSFTEEDPSLWQHNDLTPLMPRNGQELKHHQDIKSDVVWSYDISNGGYDSSGPIESPRSTGSLESEEGESRLPTAVENMEDVGVMTSQLEESNRLTFDDDFGSFDVDEKVFKKRRKGLHLWEFLLEVLDDDRYVPHLLYWVERSKGIFKIEKSQEVAKLWGRRKQRNHMTYEHMSRAMRHYYSSGIMRRIPGKRLMYQFGPRAFATSKSSS